MKRFAYERIGGNLSITFDGFAWDGKNKGCARDQPRGSRIQRAGIFARVPGFPVGAEFCGDRDHPGR